jgi:hypothetical protein
MLEEEKLKLTESEETFKPKTNDYNPPQGSKQKYSSGDRNFDLYSTIQKG